MTTEMFLRDNKSDSDFSHLCLYGFEEQKHVWFLLVSQKILPNLFK